MGMKLRKAAGHPRSMPRLFYCVGMNSRSTITHRPGISCLPIRKVHTASPFSFQVEQ